MDSYRQQQRRQIDPSLAGRQQHQHQQHPYNSPLLSNPGVSSSPSARQHVVTLYGRPLIRPNSAFARAVVMGNDASTANQQPNQQSSRDNRERSSPKHNNDVHRVKNPSNLTRLLNQEQQQEYFLDLDGTTDRRSSDMDEADSASGPQRPPTARYLGSSAPLLSNEIAPDYSYARFQRQHSTSEVDHSAGSPGGPPVVIPAVLAPDSERVRRCFSSKELITIAPPSGSPYAFMLHKKEELEISMRERLHALREHLPADSNQLHAEDSSSTSSRRRETSNAERNRKRAQHAQAVVDDLCEVVADLFIAESKLLNPSSYGVLPHRSKDDQREQLHKTIYSFVTSLPLRYALSADTPSEVLLHMRLMAAVRSDRYKVAIHIHNLTDDSRWSTHALAVAKRQQNRSLRLVTISCHDAVGLLEYISKLLATGGSRVLDADVMLTRDGIVLDRFVVEMNGRLRLDTLANLVEAFLREYFALEERSESECSVAPEKKRTGSHPSTPTESRGPLYYHDVQRERANTRNIREEMETAVRLTDVLASSQSDLLQGPVLPKFRKISNMPEYSSSVSLPDTALPMRRDPSPTRSSPRVDSPPTLLTQSRPRRPLVNRPATSNLDEFGIDEPDVDYLTVLTPDAGAVENRVPLIPFDEIMLIETLGTGRVSTIYRAAWQRPHTRSAVIPGNVHMVALKVAMVNTVTGDTSHVDELRREADIAARLSHPNICDLVGVAADAECFCLAYDFCEGGSLLSLLSDSSRYYEYLPIALDIAHGMAYLHSRNVIHRDLKPSNILLTRDHRAKIADFGMSVANTGQELTAETGTYRYMAPEVIRHESYSSNADVYSFGICLWQLITREIPFAQMTPIQAAYAVAEGRRPDIPESTPRRLQEIIISCWDQDSHKRPSFTYIAMALADYAKMAFSPANVGALTLQIANEMLATVEGNSTVNVDFSTPVDIFSAIPPPPPTTTFSYMDGYASYSSVPDNNSQHSNVGLEIE